MPTIVWWIVAVVFVAPAVILLALVLVNRYAKGNTAKTINLLWLVLAVMLTIFLGYALFGRAE